MQGLHGLFEFDPVLAPFDGVHLNADDLDPVFVQDAFLVELAGQVHAALAAQVGKQGVRPLLGDNLLQPVGVEGFDVCHIRHFRVRHDGGGVGIDQNDLIAQGAQRLAGLRSGIVELARLADNDRAGADDEDGADICSLRHGVPLSFKTVQKKTLSFAGKKPLHIIKQFCRFFKPELYLGCSFDGAQNGCALAGFLIK